MTTPKDGAAIKKWMKKYNIAEVKLGTYKYLGTVGEGTSGVVSKVKIKQRIICIKHFRKHTSFISPAFEREVKVLAKTKEEGSLNLPKIHGFILDSSQGYQFCVAMEYCPEGNLRNISTLDSYKEDMVREMFFQVTAALKYLYDELKVSHRDIKPENVLVRSWRPINVVLADFDCSKHTRDGQELVTRRGTCGYMAPEVDSVKTFFRAYTFKCDVWSLGIMTYELLNQCTRPMPDLTNKGEYTCAMIKNATDEANLLLSQVIRVLPKDRLDYDQLMNHKWGKVELNVSELPNVYTRHPA